MGQPVLDEAEDTQNRLLRLIQVASNPRLIEDLYHGIAGKVPILSDLVSDIVSRDEKDILWTTFTHNLDWLAKEFKGYNAVRILGTLAHEQRERSVRPIKTDPDCE